MSNIRALPSLQCTIRSLLAIVFTFIAELLAFPQQQPFQNLGFEDAVIRTPGTPDFISQDEALPGWAASAQAFFYNTVSIGASAISIHDRGSFEQPLFGNYSVLFQRSFNGQFVPSIWQTGTIAENAHSLFFLTDVPVPTMSVSFADKDLSLVLRSSTATRSLWGADITEFAGETGELKFTGGGMLDFITFSPEIIPEPGGPVLFLLACGLWLLRRRST